MPSLHVTDQKSQAEADRRAWKKRTPEERLDEVERLRIEALIRNKRASGRPRDLGYLEALL